MESSSISLIIILFCVIMSGYFSAAETAFSSLNRIRIKNLAQNGNKRAGLVLRLSKNYDELISTILIGNNIVNVACASLVTLIFVNMLGQERGAGISTLVTTVVVLIFGEVSPKSIAKESPEKFAMFSAPFLNGLIITLAPVNFLFRQWKKLLSLIFKAPEDRSITEEELLTIIEEAEQYGGINETEGTLIRSAIEFTELEAADIYTPRIDITGIPVDMPKDEVAEVFADTGYSRLPVYTDTMDQIIGILYQKDFYNLIYFKHKDLKDAIKPAMFITKNMKIDVLMKELQQKKLHIAVVMDEFGGTVGIITLEDILEELVGEIWDEHDTVVYDIEQVSEKEFSVSGNANVDKLFKLLGRSHKFDVLTVSGWVMETLGHIPAEGDSFESQDLEVKIIKMNGKRIIKMHITDKR